MNDKVRTRSTGLAGVTNLSVLAPLRTGMVPGIEPISYVGRLRKVLDALHAARQNLRESELWSVFPDVIGRFGIIHTFRYALVKPEAGPAGLPAEFGIWRLSLNVTFDGGWEPYMRVIQRDIGPLLDLLFCHSPTYPGASTASFGQYCDWVRQHEVPAGLFYADSTSTMHDASYLARAEVLQREGASDDALARHHQPAEPQPGGAALAAAWRNPERALALPLRTLKGLYRLTTYFPPNFDEDVLRRFAQDALNGPIHLMNRIEAATQAAPLPRHLVLLKQNWDGVKALLREELDWLQWRGMAGRSAPDPTPIDDSAALQAHVLGAGERMTHGYLVLLRVKNRQQALETIDGLAAGCGPVAPGGTGYLVGFTYPGLQELGVTPDRLDALPQEFFEGMEARFGLLGDLRTNHPDRWTRPLLWNQDIGQRADLHAVHMLVQVRLEDNANQDDRHPRLLNEVLALDNEKTGLRVLAAEPMRSYHDANGIHAVGHLGIVDGVSQPRLPSLPNNFAHYNDQVSAGELVLGYATGRGDKAPEEMASFLHNGTFLAVRKLRQFMDRLDAVAPSTTAQGRTLRATMVGRAADGAPLNGWPAGFEHDNDFRFDSEAASDACPFHSHIRRSNPRDGRAYTPRILRRGMSWGPLDPEDRITARGVMFMAYCASLAEQFETIQRWVSGGNASGVASAQGDPLLRVPREGEQYTFRYLEGGAVQRVTFSDQPLVQLQWGLYAFVPSLRVLEKFADLTLPAARNAEVDAEAARDAEVDAEAARNAEVDAEAARKVEAIRALLEDREQLGDLEKSEIVWKSVREGNLPEVQDSAYGHLVGDLAGVLAALRDRGENYSVRGYAGRMEGSIGLNLLGMDPKDDRFEKEQPVNRAIRGFHELEAFADTLSIANKVLAGLPAIPSAAGDPTRRALDLVDFSDRVLAGLCKLWFGLPDEHLMITGGRKPGKPAQARCPGSLGPASRYLFVPQPHGDLVADGRGHAKAVREAVEGWLATSPDLARHRLAQDIQTALAGTGSEQHLAANIAGTMLGFTPSVQSNFLRVMETWINEERALWVNQQSLFEYSRDADLQYAEARDALRVPLLRAIRKHPVPTMAWRSPVVNGTPDTRPDQRVVLGLQSVLADPAAPTELVFGRDHHEDAKNTTVHGCPGYQLAMGVLLAMIGSVLKVGTLRPTGSPVLLILTQQ